MDRVLGDTTLYRGGYHIPGCEDRWPCNYRVEEGPCYRENYSQYVHNGILQRVELATNFNTYLKSVIFTYLQHLLALPTIPLVAELLAGVDPTPQHLLTLLATEHQVPTLPSPAGLGTGTQHCDHSSAGRAGPSMAQLHTLVHTASYSPGSLTHLPTAVGHQAIVPVPLRIPHLPAEAPVVSGEGGGYHLAPRAPPSPTLCGGCLGPLLDATKVENLKRKL